MRKPWKPELVMVAGKNGSRTLPQNSRRPLISLMIPCFNEEQSLTHVIPQLIETLASDPEFDFELLYIDDHSSDQTPNHLAELCSKHANVRAIRLGRNCGSHAAYRAGLDFCTGDAVAFTVADLQEGVDLIQESLRLLWKAQRNWSPSGRWPSAVMRGGLDRLKRLAAVCFCTG